MTRIPFGDPIDADPAEPVRATDDAEQPRSTRPPSASLRDRLRHHETEIILDALRRANWNQSRAARELGLPRRTLVYRIKTLGIVKLGFGSDSRSQSSGTSSAAD